MNVVESSKWKYKQQRYQSSDARPINTINCGTRTPLWMVPRGRYYHPDDDFNAAITLARKNGFEVAYSNQAFEYWFLLHFNLYQGALHRSRYEKMLNDLLGFPYSKKSGVSNKIFNILLPKQMQAINYAKTAMKQFSGDNPSQEESSTTVYLLVEELNRFI